MHPQIIDAGVGVMAHENIKSLVGAHCVYFLCTYLLKLLGS